MILEMVRANGAVSLRELARVVQTSEVTVRRDVRALELMLESDAFDGNRRIGAEQEMFLVDPAGRPAPVAIDVLERVADARCTTELARFNLEANLTPRAARGDALRRMEAELLEV